MSGTSFSFVLISKRALSLAVSLVCLFFTDGSLLRAQADILFPWEKNGVLCFIKADGTTVEANQDTLYYPKPILEEELFSFSKNGMFGFKNTEGAVVIPAGYEKTGKFSEGFAWVKLDYKRYYYIDRTEKPLISYTFDKCFDFSDGMAKVYDNNPVKGYEGYGYLNSEGQIIVPLRLFKGMHFVNNACLVKNEEGWWLIDSNNHRIAGPATRLREKNGHFTVK